MHRYRKILHKNILSFDFLFHKLFGSTTIHVHMQFHAYATVCLRKDKLEICVVESPDVCLAPLYRNLEIRLLRWSQLLYWRDVGKKTTWKQIFGLPVVVWLWSVCPVWRLASKPGSSTRPQLPANAAPGRGWWWLRNWILVTRVGDLARVPSSPALPGTGHRWHLSSESVRAFSLSLFLSHSL